MKRSTKFYSNQFTLTTGKAFQNFLSETFTKFDRDGSGRLEESEFIKAWEFLGLKGSRAEIKDAYNKVDTDGSGYIDRREFIASIRDSVTTFTIFDGKRFFNKYHKLCQTLKK